MGKFYDSFRCKLASFLTLFLLILPMYGNVAKAQSVNGDIPYAVYDWEERTLTFYCTKEKPEGSYGLNLYDNYGRMQHQWTDKDIETVIFDKSFSSARPTDCSYWFYSSYPGLLQNIVGIENLNTTNVTDMSCMFAGCDKLTSLDLSKFKTMNVTNMRRMFYGCTSLTSLDLSNFNNTNVTDMSYMFESCQSLTSLDLSNFNTANVTDMSGMFSGCQSLSSLDLSNFNTTNVTNMGNMFYGCTSLTSLDLSNFCTDYVESTYGIFSGCKALTSIDLSNFNTEYITQMGSMFSNCEALTSIDLSKFNTTNATDISYMFSGCKALTSLNLSSFNTEYVYNMGGMFDGCENLESLNLSSFNTEYVEEMDEMFKNCYNLTTLDLSNFNTKKVNYMREMFCMDAKQGKVSRLKTIYASELFKLYALRNGENMFSNCTSLEGAIKYNPKRTDHRYANYTNGYFTYKENTSTGISGVDAEQKEGKAAYFDLQGNRLNSPTHGVNIVRKGNRSSKVFIK